MKKTRIKNRAIGPFIGFGSLVGILGLGCEQEASMQKVIYVYPDAYTSESNTNPTQQDAQSRCQKYFEDKDGDGYGNYKSWLCEPLSGYVDNGDDCNDYDSLIHPGASDYCSGDGIDNNCDGKVDEEGISHYQKGCSDGDIYWLDSCGSLEDLLEDCAGNYVCEGGECVCQPNCNGKECGDDGCGGSCGGCGTCEKCSYGECWSYTDEEILTKSICTITDTIGFSLSNAGHNLEYNDMESANYACANSEGIACKYDSKNCWAQWDMTVNKNCDLIRLKLEGQTYSYYTFHGQIDNLSFGAGSNLNNTPNDWNLYCKSIPPTEGVIKTTFNGINFTSDGAVTFQFSNSKYSQNFLSSAQILSCTCPKEDN
jgi:hypothetical protein